MTNLEQLRQLVATMFDGAQDKEQIEQLATLNNSIDAVQREQDELVDKNAELIKSYKDLVKHTSFSTGDKPVDGLSGATVSIDDAIAAAMAKLK